MSMVLEAKYGFFRLELKAIHRWTTALLACLTSTIPTPNISLLWLYHHHPWPQWSNSTIPRPFGMLFPLLTSSFPLNSIDSSVVTLNIFYSRKHFPNSKFELVAPCFCFCVYVNHDLHSILITSLFADPALTDLLQNRPESYISLPHIKSAEGLPMGVS